MSRDKLHSIYVCGRDISDRGKNEAHVFDVVSVKVHEEYREDYHDLALLKVDRPFM